MAVTVAQMTVAVAEQGSADLLFLMEDAEVGIVVQHTVIVTHGFKTVRLLSGLEEDRKGIRAACKDVFGLDPAIAESRLSTAKIITVWEAAKESLSQELRLKTEAKVLGAAEASLNSLELDTSSPEQHESSWSLGGRDVRASPGSTLSNINEEFFDRFGWDPMPYIVAGETCVKEPSCELEGDFYHVMCELYWQMKARENSELKSKNSGTESDDDYPMINPELWRIVLKRGLNSPEVEVLTKGPNQHEVQREFCDGTCFTFNNGKTCDGTCGRVHICRVNRGGNAHPAVEQGKGSA